MSDGAGKTQLIQTQAEARERLERLEESAGRTRANLRKILAQVEPALSALSRLKFTPVGCDPLDPERALNLVEQLNQTFTYQAAFEAAAWLLDKHPDHAPFELSLGTAAGIDIMSHDKHVLAEVFAAVDPRNNKKLQHDIGRLAGQEASFRYVLYLSPTTGGNPEEFESSGVHVVRLHA